MAAQVRGYNRHHRMSLGSGARLGAYEIVSAIGAGGMGEVYRARDTKLNRDVAIKILPELFAADRERLARFEREAQTLAALNHPHIAQIYGVVEHPAAIVMEFADGEELAHRIARGPVPIDDALAIARQMADALEAAHEHGIVHRDLKPANVKVKPDGTVKVLDFGLAKAMTTDATQAVRHAELANSPTFTSPALLTSLGVIVGTAAYMAPEQAKGKTIDRRADLWAFGVVLYEMLSGRAAYDGETVTDVLAAVVTRDPDWTQLPATTPPGVRRLLARCLTRDPKNRLADAGEARHQLDEAAAQPAPAIGASPPPTARSRGGMALVPWIVAALLAGVAGWLVWQRPHAPEPLALRYAVETPPKTTLNVVSRPAIALSPDGTSLAYVGTSAGISRIYVRRQSEFESRAIQGTEGGSEPVFSPDGRWIAFVAGNKLNKVLVGGGSVEPIANVNDPRGFAWDTPDVITFSPEAVSGIFEVAPQAGAVPKPITTPVANRERTHRWPQRLPGGATIFTVGSLSSPDNYDDATIEAVSPTGERQVLVKGASMARYVPPGALVFVRASRLFAVAFDPHTLAVTGTPVPLGTLVAGDSTTGASSFAYAAGAFAYVPGVSEAAQHRLAWMDRTGRTEAVDLHPGMYFDVALAPDGMRAAVEAVGSGGTDIWVYDFDRKTDTRLTFGGSHRTPVWSRDGAFVYYDALAADGSSNDIRRKRADGSRDEELITTLKKNTFLRDIDSGGQLLIDYNSAGRGSTSDIATLSPGPDAAPVPVIATPFDDWVAKWSPDHRWIAYQSNESSRMEVYVREASGQGGRWQISTAGGEEPRWSADGRELYYRNDTQMMAVSIEPGPAFRSGQPRLLFDGLYNLRSESNITYDVDSKRGRFLAIRLAEDASPATAIRVALDWSSELSRLMKTP
jgi:serine/threonine-protein kinase